MRRSKVSEAAALLGARGGKRSLETMTRAARVRRARKAIAARWARREKGGR